MIKSLYNHWLPMAMGAMSIYMVAYVRMWNQTVQSATILRKANKIVVEWLESKDAGKRHRVNIKHISGKIVEVTVSSEVIKLNSQCYHAKIVDLLDWTPCEKKRPVRRKWDSRDCSSKRLNLTFHQVSRCAITGSCKQLLRELQTFCAQCTDILHMQI